MLSLRIRSQSVGRFSYRTGLIQGIFYKLGDGIIFFIDSEEGESGGVPVKYIGQKQFILNKRATGRQRDLSDLEAIDEQPPLNRN